MPEVLKVLITGAAGQIAYNLSNMVANGNMFGPNQKVSLNLFDLQCMETVLGGVVMELEDCAFPCLESVHPTHDINDAFKDIDVALMVGAMPRKQGMERKDLLKSNVAIFKEAGLALEKNAKKTCKVLVVGNPANTNCLIMSKYAPSFPKTQFSCLTRLDHNRATYQVAHKCGVSVTEVSNVIIWGNHSNTQVPDVTHAMVMKDGKKLPASQVIGDDKWISGTMMPLVQVRGAAVIAARKLSSAASAAKAIVDQMHDWWLGSKPGETVSMGVYSKGEFGAPEDIFFSFPCVCTNGEYTISSDIKMVDYIKPYFDITAKELSEEKESAIASLQ